MGLGFSAVLGRDRQVGKSSRRRIGRAASSAQRIRRTAARQSENVRSGFLTPISCGSTPELRNGLKCLEQVGDAPQAAGEPRRHAAQDVLRSLLRVFAFGGRGMVDGIPLSGGDGEVERECHDQDQPGQPVWISDLAVFEAEAARFEVREHRLDAHRRA